MGFPSDSDGKESAAMHETLVHSLGQEDPLEKEIATYSSIPWISPWVRKELETTERLNNFGSWIEKH